MYSEASRVDEHPKFEISESSDKKIMSGASLSNGLSRRTSLLGLRLWVVVAISVSAVILVFLTLLLITLCLTSRRRRKQQSKHSLSSSPKKTTTTTTMTVDVSREIQVDPTRTHEPDRHPKHQLSGASPDSVSKPDWNEGRLTPTGTWDHVGGSDETRPNGDVSPAVGSRLGWGHWYTLRELEECTNGLSAENIIGEGGYGIVYYGELKDGTRVAVKNLLNDNRGQADREFKVEVEAIGRVRHKNLVRLLGYCVQELHRMLVYEYVDNGNLEQWLHGDVGPCSPLTWDIRMNIVLGTAKGLSYLHEGIEPKVIHRDIKSSNILLDKHWIPKVSDFGLAKLIGPERSYVTTRVMGTFGYVAPEYASTGMLNERSDVYSFGILIMEIITGRNPVDYSRPTEEVSLIDWLKTMISNRNADGVLDPKLPEKPSSRALKRVLLVALRCVDPNARKRPTMGQVVHMLEADDFPFRDDRKVVREHGRSHREGMKQRSLAAAETGDSSGYESSVQTDKSLFKRQETDDEK